MIITFFPITAPLKEANTCRTTPIHLAPCMQGSRISSFKYHNHSPVMRSGGSERAKVAPTMQLASGRIRLPTLRAIPCTTHPNTPLPHPWQSRLALQCYFNHTFMIKAVVQYILHLEKPMCLPEVLFWGWYWIVQDDCYPLGSRSHQHFKHEKMLPCGPPGTRMFEHISLEGEGTDSIL